MTMHRNFRKRLPNERPGITHKFCVGGHEGYINVGMFPDGSPGEVFITMSKTGSTISGLMDSFATAISIGLQYNVPIEVFCDKFKGMRFDPKGFTDNPAINEASSVIDYIFKWIELKFTDAKPEGVTDWDKARPIAEKEPATVSKISEAPNGEGKEANG